MAVNTEKNSYTILFAIAMVVVVGSLLAFTASSLKPAITKNKEIEKQQNILYAFGVNENEGTGDITFVSKEKVSDAFKANIKEQIVLEAKDGKILKEMTREEFINSKDQGAGIEPYLIDIKKEQTKAKNGESRFLPLFKGTQDGKTIYVVPIRGKGLWDAIWGYVGLDESMTVQGTFFDHAGETPGLGANIKQRYFMDDFYGEKLLTDAGVFKGINVAKGNNDPVNKIKDDFEVDALAGATITGDGVSAMIKKDLKLYLPYFKNLKNNNN
ncbi:Na+-transporting NADH:ubiquinone oxidoreductase subunit C [Lacinutrix venerupis]|uniref:Na(+)-translocating NADH-quinone reductase subunit C n=1 Tax=Lacinutrix venerupis TaxID=1486034 RepID=UPI000EAB4CAC|nr:Na(+)-translocating NADH-quinone reductase subunit C [Lacinutrix venerupis]RLJ67336.1 Na+-transporting NADH:ubiquinone oxidoreductase subunit C [Lacinutrix venerupis]